MTVTIRMWTKEGYHKDILVFDDQQTRMSCGGVDETIHGIRIDPEKFPEATHFTIVVDRWSKKR